MFIENKAQFEDIKEEAYNGKKQVEAPGPTV